MSHFGDTGQEDCKRRSGQMLIKQPENSKRINVHYLIVFFKSWHTDDSCLIYFSYFGNQLLPVVFVLP